MHGGLATHIRTNAVAYVALFLVVSAGTAYATHAPNTVTTEDIVDGQVTTADIRDETVVDNDVKNGALRGVEIRDGTLTSIDVADDTTPNALNGIDIQNASLTGLDLADDSLKSSDVDGIWSPDVIPDGLTGADITGLGSVDVLDNSLTGGDVAADTLGSEDVRQEGLRGEDIDEGTLDLGIQRAVQASAEDSTSPKAVDARCPVGTQILGGGASISGGTSGSYPNMQGKVVLVNVQPSLAFREMRVSALETSGGTNADWSVTAWAMCARLAG